MDYEFLDFEARDEIDTDNATAAREVLTGLPARPGVIR